MYVRLAFAVAAHLEPEILVVDEVLAVGDVEFQRKCLGKMGEVAQGGRTVLFVSHNMAAVKSLTTRGINMDRGQAIFDGSSEEAIECYTQLTSHPRDVDQPNWGRGTHTAIQAVRLLDEAGTPTHLYRPGTPLRIEVEFESDGFPGLSLEMFLLDAARVRVGLASLHQFHGQTLPGTPGRYRCELHLESVWLASGRYSADITTSVVNSNWDHYVDTALEFEVPFSNPLGGSFDFKQSYGFGALALYCSRPAVMLPCAPPVKTEAST
jgi:lipopolysaccharide transport system ATP-binding protein